MDKEKFPEDLEGQVVTIGNTIHRRRVAVLNRQAIKRLWRKILGLVLLLWLIFKFILGLFVVYNDDMFPKMVASDLAVYFRLDRNYFVGDVVVTKASGKEGDFLLRLVAGPGDEVDLTKEGRLVINGATQLEEEIFFKTDMYEDGVTFPLKLKEDEYFALGDMRRGAVDSRYFGPVKKKDLKGKVFALYRRANF